MDIAIQFCNYMLTEEQDITGLFDEFYLIPEAPSVQPVKEKEIPKEIPKEFSFSGANNKRILFVYDQPVKLSGDELQMVENLVTRAIGWSMDDLALMNLSEQSQQDFARIKTFFNPQHIIFWGCDAFLSSNNIPQKMHEVLHGKEMKVLSAHAPVTYQQQPELKKALWDSIRQLFDLK